MRRFHTRWQNWFGLLLAVVFVLIAAAAPLLSPQDPANPGPIKRVGRIVDRLPRPPTEAAPLGTLPGQISVYHSLVWGTRSALVFGLAAALFTALLGMLVGVISAYFGGVLNDVLMRITDAFLAFPLIAGVVLMQQVITIRLAEAGAMLMQTSPPGAVIINRTYFLPEGVSQAILMLLRIDPVLIAFILFSWTPYARIMNAVVLSIKEMGYIQAARALGAGSFSIMFRHLIPNAVAPLVILAARDVGGMVLLQATFTFIGFGGNSIWGTLLVNGRDWIIGPGGGIFTYWWLFLPVTVALMLFAISWDLVGDWLNEALNLRTG